MGVTSISGEFSDLVCLSTVLFTLLVACLAVFINCLLKAVAFCCGVMAFLFLKFMMVFGGVEDFLPPRYPLCSIMYVCSFCGHRFVRVWFSIDQLCV